MRCEAALSASAAGSGASCRPAVPEGCATMIRRAIVKSHASRRACRSLYTDPAAIKHRLAATARSLAGCVGLQIAATVTMLHCTFVIIFWPARAKPRHLEQFIGHAYFCPRDAAGCGERVRELGLAMDRRVRSWTFSGYCASGAQLLNLEVHLH